MAGLVAHMAASSVFLWVGFFVYGGTVDAFHYWTVGLQLAEKFQIAGWTAFQPPYWSTNLINNMCGIATLLIGDALPTLFIGFALVSLAGGYLFYRAFTIAFPDGDRWLFGLLVILLPSLLFWSSFVGKDSLIQYFIALTAFGFARLTQRASPGSCSRLRNWAYRCATDTSACGRNARHSDDISLCCGQGESRRRQHSRKNHSRSRAVRRHVLSYKLRRKAFCIQI